MLKKIHLKETRIIPETVYQLLGISYEWPSTESFHIRKFKNVPFTHIQQVAQILGDSFLNECQNFSPSTSDFLEHLAPYALHTMFDGYIVSPYRMDERVTIEAVFTRKTDDTFTFLRHADSLSINGDYLYANWS